MNFNIPEVPSLEETSDVRVGNVYPSKGGGKTKYWVIIGLDGRMASALGINAEGIVTSATAYGRHAFESRASLGFVEGLETLSFDITWR